MVLFALIEALGSISGAHFNPAVTVGRMLSDTFAGIAPASVPMFVVMQVVGALAALGIGLFLFPGVPATDLAVPRSSQEPT